jgi:hypothetical protein
MEGLRMVPGDSVSLSAPCSCCAATGQRWDRIAGTSYCPDCEEALARGDGPTLIARTEKQRCCICEHVGTIRYLTAPLDSPRVLEIDLCPDHVRALVARRLGPFAYHQLGRRLQGLQLGVEQIFLLHNAFYNSQGQALQPVGEAE